MFIESCAAFELRCEPWSWSLLKSTICEIGESFWINKTGLTDLSGVCSKQDGLITEPGGWVEAPRGPLSFTCKMLLKEKLKKMSNGHHTALLVLTGFAPQKKKREKSHEWNYQTPTLNETSHSFRGLITRSHMCPICLEAGDFNLNVSRHGLFVWDVYCWAFKPNIIE